MADTTTLVRRLLKVAGTTYAEESGIRLEDKPMPLFQLLVLTMLASKPINAEIAARAARELFDAGLRTPHAVIDGTRSTAIDAFGRAGYTRYDESSATRLCELATSVRDEYAGDLRKLANRCEHDVARASEALQEFTGIGPTGADVFLREVQSVWPWVRPYFDARAVAAAKDLHLPTSAERLGDLAPRHPERLAVALVRVSLDDRLRDDVVSSDD